MTRASIRSIALIMALVYASGIVGVIHVYDLTPLGAQARLGLNAAPAFTLG